MPYYEYACDECGQKFEALQRISDEPLNQCPHCGASSVRKLISKTSFVLKGSGWYATDYARKGNNSSKSSESSSKSSESSSAAAQ